MTRSGSHKSEDDWNVAIERATVSYPGIKSVNWQELFAGDMDMVGRIIGDILKLRKAEENPHRRGRRTVPQVAAEEIWEMFEGFSSETFEVALTKLMRGKTVRQVAIRLNMSHMSLYRLMKGTAKPTMQIIEDIATAFNKPPHYFVEYRAMFLANYLETQLMAYPRLSIELFKSIIQDGAKS